MSVTFKTVMLNVIMLNVVASIKRIPFSWQHSSIIWDQFG
jgi:hypothetical protein